MLIIKTYQFIIQKQESNQEKSYQSMIGQQHCQKYHEVHIQNLTTIQQPLSQQIDSNTLIDRLNISIKEGTKGTRFAQLLRKPLPKRERQVYCYMDTGLKQRIFNKSNQFFMSFFLPYNNHADILLSPDNIWLAIMFFLSKYIDSNAEKLRHHFVSHEGKKQLVVQEIVSYSQESVKMEKQWDYFFDEIIKQIKKNTKQGVVQGLACNFSTTTKIYETISTSIIMSSFKKYFDYCRILTMCGIRNVYFDGTRQDWVKVQQKLLNLCQYDIDNELKNYVQKMSVVLDKFIETYDGKVDKQWWNKIMVLDEDEFVGSGSRPGKYVEGWILDFFGISGRTHVDDIPNYQISVPIKLINELTNTVKQLELTADWVSVSKVNSQIYKPDLGLCIFLDSVEKHE